MITKRAPAQLVIGPYMLFDVSFLTDWNKIKASKRKASTQNNQLANTKRVKYTYKPRNINLLSDGQTLGIIRPLNHY